MDLFTISNSSNISKVFGYIRAPSGTPNRSLDYRVQMQEYASATGNIVSFFEDIVPSRRKAFAYIRPYSQNATHDSQKDAIIYLTQENEYNLEFFVDKLSRKGDCTSFPSYISMMDRIRSGDILVVCDRNVFSRNLIKAQSIINELIQKKISVIILS